MSTTFDQIIAVDGSAASAPKRGADSIWISVDRDGAVTDPENISTRAATLDRLAELCHDADRTLVAVDWSLGYPSGSSTVFGLDGPTPRAAMWAHLVDQVSDASDNRNNRFEVAAALNARTSEPGPFWGAPVSAVSADLTSTKQPFVAVAEWREVEQRLRADRSQPKSCWQLGGAGAVGSQSLLGIPLVAELVGRTGPGGAVWPFDTRLAEPDADVRVVVAEMWPTLFASTDDLPAHWIRDAAQVDASVRRIRAAERSGELAEWFRPSPDHPDAVVDEEGWILGLR